MPGPNRRVAMAMQPPTRAIVQALLVTFLWSTSWVLIKLGLRAELPAITFAGLRYSLAFLCLLPFVLVNPAHRAALRALSRVAWARLALLGIVFYVLTQGAQFVGLALLPAATLTLLLNLSPIVVALFGIALTVERPTRGQWSGILLSAVGALIYFYPLALPAGQFVGLAVGGVGLLANAKLYVLTLATKPMGPRANRHSSIRSSAVFAQNESGGLAVSILARAWGWSKLAADLCLQPYGRRWWFWIKHRTMFFSSDFLKDLVFLSLIHISEPTRPY